jgi:hypothetical protein
MKRKLCITSVNAIKTIIRNREVDEAILTLTRYSNRAMNGFASSSPPLSQEDNVVASNIKNIKKPLNDDIDILLFEDDQ